MIDDDEDAVDMTAAGPSVLTRKELQNSRSRLRNALQRDTAASEKRARSLASQLLYEAESSYNHKTHKDQMKSSAIINSIVGLSSKVLNSLDITPKVNVRTTNVRYNGGRPISCWTDFDSINIEIDAAVFDPDSIEQMTELVHIVKGLTYHEGGHILWTTSQETLCNQIGCTGKHALPTPNLVEKYIEELPLGFDFNTAIRTAWNMLEDQRMECLMVRLSPVMARYFTTIVAKYVIDPEHVGHAWPWVNARTYLPGQLRQMVRDAAERHEYAELIDSIDEVAMRYRNSNDFRVMHDAVIKMAELLTIWVSTNERVGEYDKHKWTSVYKVGKGDAPELEGQVTEKPTDKAADDKSNESGNASMDGSEGDETSDQDGSGEESGEQKAQSENTSTTNQEAGKGEGTTSTRDYLNNLVNDNISQTSVDEVSSFIGEINDSRNQMALPDNSTTKMDTVEVNASVGVKNRMLDVLDRLIVQVDPSWLFYQENGIIDPTTYLTREPGDTNFWSGMEGDNANGHDLAVSLLIDSSGSMDYRINNVSVIAMGIRKACEHYDIPCTITTFSDKVGLVAAGDQDVDFVKVEAGGGTQIMQAMMLLDQQRYGRAYHLVVILTDGEWSDTKDIRIWGTPTRHIMVVGVNVSHEIISNKGANSAITISDVNELAPLVTNALAGYFTN